MHQDGNSLGSAGDIIRRRVVSIIGGAKFVPFAVIRHIKNIYNYFNVLGINQITGEKPGKP